MVYLCSVSIRLPSRRSRLIYISPISAAAVWYYSGKPVCLDLLPFAELSASLAHKSYPQGYQARAKELAPEAIAADGSLPHTLDPYHVHGERAQDDRRPGMRFGKSARGI